MRRRIPDQLTSAPPQIDHQHALELVAADRILKALPELEDAILADLVGERDARRGRPGLTPQQVLRILIVKQMRGFSYEELSFHLADSKSYRSFCQLPAFGSTPSTSALQSNIKRIKSATLERVNRALLRKAAESGIEDGRTVRVDATTVASNIHHPTDNALLKDTVFTLTRLMKKARKAGLEISGFSDRTRVTKKLNYKIINAKTQKPRLKPYRRLVAVTSEVLRYAERVADDLKKLAGDDTAGEVKAAKLASKLTHFITLGRRVVSQTETRVFQNESVPATEKVVSIFEPHSDVIRKNNNTHYGHKATLSTGVSGLVLDCIVESGNPADSTRTLPMLERHREIYGCLPETAAFDGAYASKENLTKAKESGVENVAFSNAPYLSQEEMVEEKALFRWLFGFRAGIEAGISILKRCFGLRRCLARGLESFRAWVWTSVLSANVLRLARIEANA